jgi:phage-related protein
VSATDQPERSEQHDNRSQHALSCRAIDLRINRRGWRSGSGEAQVYVLHVFEKRTRKTSKRDLALGQQRYEAMVQGRRTT